MPESLTMIEEAKKKVDAAKLSYVELTIKEINVTADALATIQRLGDEHFTDEEREIIKKAEDALYALTNDTDVLIVRPTGGWA